MLDTLAIACVSPSDGPSSHSRKGMRSCDETTTITPPTSGGSGATTPKRIPASLMKMRRESLATSGKYKLPVLDAALIPDNSLIGMTQKATTTAKRGESNSLPAFCTPRRHAPRTLQIALDRAVSHLPKPEGIIMEEDIGEPDVPVKRSSDASSCSKSKNGMSGSSRQRSFRRTLNTTNTEEVTPPNCKDMESLLKRGLATPRRTRRCMKTIPVPGSTMELAGSSSHHHSKRVAKIKSKKSSDAAGLNNGGSHCSKAVSEAPSPVLAPRRTGRMARRSKSSDDTVNVLCTPKRLMRKPSVRRCSTMEPSPTGSPSSMTRKKSVEILATPKRSRSRRQPTTAAKQADSVVAKEEEEDTVDMSSSHSTQDTTDTDSSTPAVVPAPASRAPATEWKCTCGEENPLECGFCGMCGSKQRWECAECLYANKCRFKWCGMCGIPKKPAVVGEQVD